MEATHLLLLLLLMFLSPLALTSTESMAVTPRKMAQSNPQITVMGMVYCDICSNNTFSTHSYFIPGVEVRIDCLFKAKSPRTAELISFSVNRTTDRNGIYKLEIASVDGVECARERSVQTSCRASLIKSSSSSSCNVPGRITTSDEITIKSTQANLCIYSMNSLNYRPSKHDMALCKTD
ncbi:uncharacterized protein LOC124921263 [Impatiens glandulifera]|uniref:uncharacterized protein LOC124921263 n=1 Tax=Impatiens glandulifera TaxID=253017 RepID=UPI001FB1769F|nr:uncharacterized protein LOC124921263 [Impatiens glandulifera]